MNGTIAYALSKQYVADTADSLGSLKGAPCTIKSQTETDDSYIVTFEWTGTSGVTETSQLTIKKPKDGIDGLPGKDGKDGLNGKDGQQGADGADGIGISKIKKIGTVDLVDTYRITFTDNTSFDYDVTNGVDGKAPSITIGANNNWFVDGIDTGVKAKGEKGDTGSGFNMTRQYSSISDMMADTNPANDSEIVVVVLDDVGNFYMRLSSYIDPDGETNGYLPIGSAQDISTIKGEPGKDGTDGLTPHIDSATKHWFIGTNDTGVKAEGVGGADGEDGVTPHIDSVTKHWMIGSQDTSIIAEGQDGKDGVDGITPHIDATTKHWFIGDTDTGVLAKGQDGKDGKSISTIVKDDDNNLIVTFTDGTVQNIGRLSIDIQGDFLTSDGFGNIRYYDGKFQYYNKTNSIWADIETTTNNKVVISLTPNSMKKFIAKYNMKLDRNVLLIEEPDDTIIDGQTLCFVEKVIIRRKINSAPTNETDGDLVTTIFRRDFGTYSYNGFVDNDIDPSEGEKWYYRAFPVSTSGVINNSEANNITYTPMPLKLDPCTNLNISAQDSKVMVTWNDPESEKTVDGQTGIWESTVLVYKEGTNAPTSLNDGIIAVEEKTLNQYNSSGFELEVENGKEYSFSLFAITTDGAISEKTSVSVNMYSTLKLLTDEDSLYNQQITISNGTNSITCNFDSEGKATIQVSWIGAINITCSNGTDTVNTTVQINEFNITINKTLSFLTIVTFADGTDEEILAMVQAHYDDKIKLSDYWAIGDTRTVTLSAMSATYVGESHSSQDVQLTIIDFDHDDLVTPINGKTKAAISVQLKNCLNAKGYMNSSNTNSGGWEESARRKWCNDIFYNAIPSILRNGIKQVIKKNYKVYNSNNITTTSDYCFLLSETEIFGEKRHSIDSTEGTQYEYYKTSSNRIKQVSGSSYNWWERSPHGNNVSLFCRVDASGGGNSYYASGTFGLAPCLCI